MRLNRIHKKVDIIKIGVCLIIVMLNSYALLAQQDSQPVTEKAGYNISAGDMHMRDPFVTVDRKNHCYYIITSRWKDGRGGLFAYKSEDLKNWKEIGFVFQAAPDYLGKDDFWAPDTYEYKGNYYSFLTLSNKEKGILRGTTILKSTTGALGTYKPVLPARQLNITPESMQCLDGSLFVEDNGTPWIIFSVEWCGPNVQNKIGEIWAQKLKRNLTGTVGKPHRLFRASDAKWPTKIGDGVLVTDAPFIWKDKVSGNLILTWSSFSPLYSIGQAISKSGKVLGPWEHEEKPVFSNNGGHQMIFEDLQGNLKISFHSPNESKGAKRETLTIMDIKIKDGKFEVLDKNLVSEKNVFDPLVVDGENKVCCKPEKKYDNPVKTTENKDLSIVDPFVYQYDGIYYLTGTTNDSGFDYYTSKDLITWENKGALYRKSANHIGTSAFWAPEVRYYKGKFYMTYCCYVPGKDMLQTCLAVSENPDGPFTDLYTPWFDLGYSVIDADIFVDDDGTPYVYYSKNGMPNGVATGELYTAKLKEDLSGFDGEPVFVSGASQEWEKVRWDVNRCNEGPFVFKKNDTYYMTYSANDTGEGFYGVGVSLAQHPLGPWRKCADNPLMTTDLSNNISSPGHNSIIEAPDGNLYIVYHRHADAHCKKPNWDRVVCIDRLYFDERGRLKVDGPTNTPQSVSW